MKIIVWGRLTILFLIFERCYASSACKNRSDSCPSNKADYFNTYGDTSCKVFHIRDAIYTQLAFMHQGEMKDLFRPCYRGTCKPWANNDKFATTIKSLIAVMKMKETFEVIDNEDSTTLWTMKHILSKVAEESCQWLNMAGIFISTNCSNIDYVQLDSIYSRLDLYDTLSKAESTIVSMYPNLTLKYTRPIHFCAWINHRILGNCLDTQTYNSTIRNTLNTLCNGAWQCDSQLCSIN